MAKPTSNSPLNTPSHSGLHGTYIDAIGHYGLTGDGSDETATIQAALDAAGENGIVYFGEGTFTHASSLTLYGGQTIIGASRVGTVFNYTGSGSAWVQTTPGTRIRRISMRDLKIVGTVSATYGLDLDSVSDGWFVNVWIVGFSAGSGVRIYSPTNGWSVYNRFMNCHADTCAIGYDIQATSSNDNEFVGCRAGACTTGFKITTSNGNKIYGGAVEVCTTGFYVTTSISGGADANQIYGTRFEGNGTNIDIASSNVRATQIIQPHLVDFDTASISDSGTRTTIFTSNSNAPALQMTSAYPAASGTPFTFERSAQGGSSVPAMIITDSATSTGTPITLQIETERAAGSFIRGQRGGSTYFEADATGGLRAFGTTARVVAGDGASTSFAGDDYGSATPQIRASLTDGEAAIGAGVMDGTNNRRIKLFVDHTNGVEGIFSTFSTGGIPFIIKIGATEIVRIATDQSTTFNQGDVVTNSAALATTATTGFLYIPTCAGTPTGTPTSRTGTVPMVYDTTNDKLYVYNGSWKGGTSPGAFS